jgi:hypothetical protein
MEDITPQPTFAGLKIVGIMYSASWYERKPQSRYKYIGNEKTVPMEDDGATGTVVQTYCDMQFTTYSKMVS